MSNCHKKLFHRFAFVMDSKKELTNDLSEAQNSNALSFCDALPLE